MELRTRDLNKIKRIENPYQQMIQATEKNKIFNRLKYQVYLIWAIPISLTFAEIIFLKHGNSIGANKLSLFKWISYIFAFAGSNYVNNIASKKASDIEFKYPDISKMKKELIRDAEILEKNAKI